MMRVVFLLATAAIIAPATPAFAQDHSTHNMPGMPMPAADPKAAKPKPKATKPAPRQSAPATRPARPHSPEPAQKPAAHQGHDMQEMDHSNMTGMSASPSGAMDHDAMPGMDEQNEHVGHDMAAVPTMQPAGTALPAGNGPAPRPPMDHYADRQFPPAEMARSRNQMMREQGGQTMNQIMFNLAEYRMVEGRDGYRWDGEAWFGGDINRLTLKSEGEGAFGERVESAEIQALYSRAIGPYFNLQAGIRHDLKPNPSRTYATIGFEGLAPYWFEVEGALFLSNKGDLLGRLEGYYDQRISQRLVLQPRAELNFSAQDVPENRIGAGLSSAELGLRLRYEITRQFAPYVGVSYDAKTGQTARYARADGEDPTSTNFVAGVRIWF